MSRYRIVDERRLVDEDGAEISVTLICGVDKCYAVAVRGDSIVVMKYNLRGERQPVTPADLVEAARALEEAAAVRSAESTTQQPSR